MRLMNESPNDARWRPRFTLATLFKTMLILSILTAVFGSLIRELAAGSVSAIFFLAMVIAAPLAITIAISLVDPIRDLLARRGRKK